ncbi:MAG TPA: histidinol dehydrogenase [Solirubrobacteraceae bacterium]|jgi:sulfopropanediol 3-dehydrogenase|nr:histidinol dehydrogenase [Solirubrobacteraceae bacterium]
MITYLKTAAHEPQDADPKVRELVSQILLDVEREGERAVRRYSERFDGWAPERFVLRAEEVRRRVARVPEELRGHIDLAVEQIRAFAEAQRATLKDIEVSTLPGIVLGHRHVPVSAVGAYSPGGRYPLIASSLMTTVVPRAAGVERIVCVAPPIDQDGIAPAMLYAMSVGGADAIMCVGGAHGLAALAFGLEDVEPVDMIIGAGNVYVAEAKRQLFGRVGIDLLAGPTEITVIADSEADPELIASDIVGQLEHGPTSVGWLVSTSRSVAAAAMTAIERRIAELPTGEVAAAAWRDYGEVVVCNTQEEAAQVSDRFAGEHVEVHTTDPGWYLDNLKNYGSLFLGDETTVPYGDKGVGTNHVLPTAGAARYTGGLWIGKFIKTLTYQRATQEGSANIAPAIVAISEAERLPGHARSAQDRLDRIVAAPVEA